MGILLASLQKTKECPSIFGKPHYSKCLDICFIYGLARISRLITHMHVYIPFPELGILVVVVS